MKPDYTDKWLATQIYCDDGDVYFCAIQLDQKTKSSIRRAVKAWHAAAADYGNEDVDLSVYEDKAYWVRSLPSVWEDVTVQVRWGLMDTSPIAALAFAGEDGDLNGLISSSLLSEEEIMASTKVLVEGGLRVMFNGRPKYKTGDWATPALPKEVVDWIMG